MDKFEAIRTFSVVVEEGGFAAAARKMGHSRSVVNKQVIQLEQALGIQLLTRSTRKVTPTQTGLVFYQQVKDVLHDLDSAIAAATELQDTPKGNLRINAPMTFGTRHLAKVVADYMALYPEVHVELTLNDRFVDPIEEGFDLTLRIGEVAVATSLISTGIVPSKRVICASSTYLATHGEPEHPRELRQHRCLHYGYQASGSQWPISGVDGEQAVRIGCVMWSNNGEVLRDAAIKHQGIALLPTFIVGAALQSGQLRTILPEYTPAPIALYALYPRHRHASAKVRNFVELLTQRFGDAPYWDM